MTRPVLADELPYLAQTWNGTKRAPFLPFRTPIPN
jgi:hypothetical protein